MLFYKVKVALSDYIQYIVSDKATVHLKQPLSVLYFLRYNDVVSLRFEEHYYSTLRLQILVYYLSIDVILYFTLQCLICT